MGGYYSAAWDSGVGSVEFEHGEEGFLRDFYGANLLHALLAFFLLLEEFALSGDVAAVAFCGHVLAHGLDGLAGDNFRSYGCLNSDVELLTRYQLLELLTHAASESDGVVDMGEGREGVDALAVEENIELDELRLTEVVDMVVEGGIAFGDALELVVEVNDDFPERHVEDKLHTVARDIFLLHELPALGEAERHNRAYIVGGGDD